MRPRLLLSRMASHRYVCTPGHLRAKLTQENGNWTLELGSGDATAEIGVSTRGGTPDERLWDALTALCKDVERQDFVARATLSSLEEVRNALGLRVWVRGQPRPDNRW